MCGATSAQTDIQDQQQQFYKQLTSEYGTVFGENQSILAQLTKSLSPIVAAGPDQQGFGAAENTALNTEATEGVAGNYGKAEQALQENQAAQGGGDVAIGSGGNEQLRGELASTAAGTESGLQTQITENNYATGRTQYDNAVGALGGVASQYNPTGYSGAATGAGSAAASTANQIAQDDNSVWTSVMGALGGVAGDMSYSSKAGFGLGG